MIPTRHSASSNPSGFVLQKKNGKTFYHAGNTALFDDMKRLGEQFSIDTAFASYAYDTAFVVLGAMQHCGLKAGETKECFAPNWF